MVILVTILSRNGGNSAFFLLQNDFEASFNVFTESINDGDTLLEVAVLNGITWARSSIELFDEYPSLKSIKRVVTEYQQTLDFSFCSQSFIDRQMAVRMNDHSIRIRQLEKAVLLANRGLQRVRDTILGEPLRTQTLKRLQNILDRFQRSLTSERINLQRLIEVYR